MKTVGYMPISESNLSQYKFYVDLDGVMANFNKKFDTSDNRTMWKYINSLYKVNEPIWGDLELMYDADILWNYVKKYDPTFLTATGAQYLSYGGKEKKEWVKKHFGNYETIVVERGVGKAKYASPKAILIDDTKKNIDAWNEAGGIGILHKDARTTIKQLEKL